MRRRERLVGEHGRSLHQRAPAAPGPRSCPQQPLRSRRFARVPGTQRRHRALPADDGTRGEYRNFPVDESLSESVRQILEHSPLASQFGDIERDVERVATEIQAELDEIWDGYIDSIDILRPVFYRNKGAYLVGRLRWLNRVNPVILPVAVTSDGSVRVDAVLLTDIYSLLHAPGGGSSAGCGGGAAGQVLLHSN